VARGGPLADRRVRRPAAWLSLHAERFHWKASVAGLDADLGGLLPTEHVVLHFPREKTEDERRLLARDAEVSWRAVREFAGLRWTPRPFTSSSIAAPRRSAA